MRIIAPLINVSAIEINNLSSFHGYYVAQVRFVLIVNFDSHLWKMKNLHVNPENEMKNKTQLE